MTAHHLSSEDGLGTAKFGQLGCPEWIIASHERRSNALNSRETALGDRVNVEPVSAPDRQDRQEGAKHMNYWVVVKSGPPPDLARKIIEAHAEALNSRQRGRKRER